MVPSMSSRGELSGQLILLMRTCSFREFLWAHSVLDHLGTSLNRLIAEQDAAHTIPDKLKLLL